MTTRIESTSPEWFRTACYVFFAAFLAGLTGIVLALIWRLIRWIAFS